MSNRLTFSLASLIVLIAFGLVFVATPAMAASLPAGAKITGTGATDGDIIVVQGQEIDITFPTATPTELAGADPATDPAGVMSATLTPTSGGISPSTDDPPTAQTSGDLQGLVFTFDAATGVGKLKGNANPNLVGLQLVTYTISETDGGADADTDPAAPATLTFGFEVREQTALLTFGGATIANKELTAGTYFYEVLPAAQDGVGPLTYSLVGVTTETPAGSGIFTGGSLPAGLTFVPATRVLSGTPNAADPRDVLTYTVTDSTPTAVTRTISFTIEVEARVNGPRFAITEIDDAAYTKGRAITAMTLPAADTTNALGSVSYALAPLPKGLSFNATSRELSGTPNPDGDAVTTVTAMYTAEDQSGNDASVPFEITVNRVVSVTAPANVEDHTLGEPFADISVTVPAADSGIGTGAKTVEVTGLPAGLTFADMAITGDPTATGTSTVTITATDTLGAMGSADFTIEVVAAPVITFAEVVEPQIYEVGKPITPDLLPVGAGGIPPLTYALDNLPDGITFDPTTRLLRGTPTTATPIADYDYVISDNAFGHIDAASRTADHPANSITLPITITVTEPAPVVNSAPDFGDATVANIVATAGEAIQGRFLPEATDADGDTLTYSIVETLPDGLAFDATTRALTGTPTTAMDQMAYTYQVDDGNGGMDTIGFFITVNAAPTPPPVTNNAPDFGDATVANIVATAGEAIQGRFLPEATDADGDTLTYSIVETLPTGLAFDATTRALTGTPTTAMDQTGYTYMVADGNGGTDDISFFITVNAAPTPPPPVTNNAPDFGDATIDGLVATVGEQIPGRFLPEATDADGDTLTYSIVETLPAGLAFDATTRALTGTPTAASVQTAYTYQVADGNGGMDTIRFFITVNAAPTPPPVTNNAPDFGDATVANIVATAGEAIQGRFLPEATDADGDTLTYSISPALPTGLAFNASTRALTGTPTAMMAQTAYTYMVADGNGGTDDISFFITVNAAPTPPPVTNMPPAFAADAKVDNIVATAGEAISGRFLPAATDPDGDTVRYWISPALPNGLVFNATTRALTGTPSAMMAQTAYTYNAADVGSLTTPAQLPFFITVNPEPNVAPVYADTTPIAITGTAGVAITPVDASATDPNGDTLTYSWDVDSALLGLTLNASTGMISGTPLKAHTGSHPVTATDPGGLSATRGVNITIAAAPPANVAPVVTITTTAPTAAQNDSFAIAYTATDANAGDTVTVNVTHTVSPASAMGYTVTHDTATKMVTIMQAAGSPIAVIEVTITATDAAGLSDSENISVTFAAKGTPPVDSTPPMVTITLAPAANMTVGGTTYTDVLSVTLDFNEPIDAASLSGKIGRVGGDTYEVLQIGTPMVSATDNTVYTVYVNSPGYETRAQTRVLLKLGVMDVAGNSIPVDNIGIYTPPAVPAPTVAIAANPHPINCDTGSTITFTITGSTEKLVAGDITVGAGWMIGSDNNPADGTINIVPDGNNAIGITTVEVKVAANAVMNAAPTPKGNAEAKMTFTVGPVLTIPANSYILVNHPAHTASHLNDPLVLGQIQIRAPEVAIQKWECMPDLTVFFGRSAPAIGGGAIVIKEADGPLGHDPGGTKADIKKGSVGLSEIMWASDEGIQHGGVADPNTGRLSRTNYDQTREQWIELHNRNNAPVKVTLFARPTNTALTTESDEIDRVSNYNINNVWAPKGQSGNSEFGINFVSMQRGKHDNAGLAPNTADGYAHGHWNGSHANRWTASSFSYLTARAGLAHTGQLAAENLNYDFLGTPGRSNKPGVSTPILRTNVPKNSIVFNEVANRRDQTLEWIELKNVSDKEVNLKKYQISLATAKGTDVVFYNFPDNDNIKLAAGELLLLLDTSPRDNDAHPIAVGQDRDTGNDQALGLGQNQDPKSHLVKYKVANFREGGLPDDGNFVLYLRNGNDKIGQRAKVIDVIGWSDKLKDDANHTHVWPLQVFGAPDARNKIAVETVHYRQHRIDPDKNTHGDDKDEHQALRDAGYTGIGYKRHAQRIAAHGGTPGYEEIRKNEDPQLAQGNLTISEIMFEQGDGSFPQWIEIYNSSETEAVNLHAGDHGWRLIIENFDDGEIPVKRLSGTLNFRSSEVQTILPQQTVIVASTRARNSGSAFFDTRVVFPATRVFSVWDDARGELDMKRSTDPILSEQGFYIELIDGKNNFVDGVGNLVRSPNRRVAANKAWELSDVAGGMAEDGRSSILRRYREYKDGKLVGAYTAAQIETMGVEAAGWIAAHGTKFLDVRQTWFGHPSDYGSPGITGGRVLPVELSKFRPERLESGDIVIRWVTQSELNNAGFNILRSETKDGEFTKINTKLIAGNGTTSERNTYEWKDTSAKPNVVYYYQIQDVSLDGKVQTLRMSRLKGHISAAGKATTTWGELKALQ